MPLFLFGILFGLSMAYHVLLLNRTRSFQDRGASNEELVSQGIRLTLWGLRQDEQEASQEPGGHHHGKRQSVGTPRIVETCDQ